MTTPSIELMFKQSFDSVMELAGRLPPISVNDLSYDLDGRLAVHVLALMQSAHKDKLDLSTAILSNIKSAKRKGRKAGK